jgi:ABC-type nitrate/sulfonate/bicarbonate transport system permease component
LPKIFAGLRVSLSLALILMVISELRGSTDGIGYQMIKAQRTFDMPGMWAGIVLLGILGYVLNALLLAVQNRVIGWHTRSRSLTGR